MKHLKQFESFNGISPKGISHIKDLKVGNVITYQGSKYEVLSEGEFSVTIKSLRTSDELTINQGQLIEYGVRLTQQ